MNDAQTFRKVYSLFTNCGYMPVDDGVDSIDGYTDDALEINDLLTSPDMTRFRWAS